MQRYLQKRNEIITPPRKSQGQRQWLIARSLCHYQLFNLTDIPTTRRDAVLQLKVQQWSPFRETASYCIWQEGYAQVWIWNQQQQQMLLREVGLKKATVFPETVLYPRPLAHVIQLIESIEGVEGQIWNNGLLTGSHWWAQLPSKVEWNNFQRQHHFPANVLMPTPFQPPKLKRPWGKNRKFMGSLNIYRESLWLTLGTIIFTTLFTWQIVTIWRWQQALHQIQAPVEQLTEQVAPILTARTQAMQDKSQIEQILALIPFPSQLELMAQVSQLLPQSGTIIKEWYYQAGELRFTIETTRRDPTFYVENFQMVPWFKDVKVENGRTPEQIVISTRLEPIAW
jgi:hypothetical protein